MSEKKKNSIYDKNTTLEQLLDDGYGGLEALQILDMIRNGDSIDDLVDSAIRTHYN